jgi:putative sigma-54 modulation protein
MELFGHDFYVFVDRESDHTCVLYKRSDGDYGMIEPNMAQAEAS